MLGWFSVEGGGWPWLNPRMAIIDVVKWNGTPDILAWKYPSEQEFGEHDGHQAQGETPAVLDGSADQEGETDGDGYDEERQRQHLEDRVLVHDR